MNRRTPIPKFVISTNIIPDSETGENIATVIIDANVGEFSNGILFLDEPGDLIILRDAIDNYISSHNIKNTEQ